MEQIYESLKSLITPKQITQLSERFNIKESDVSEVISSAFAGFLVLTQINGETPQMRKIFDEAGSLDILSRVETDCVIRLTPEAQSAGDGFLHHILGDHVSDFISLIALRTGLDKPAVSGLVAIFAPIFVAYVGDRLLCNRWSMHKLLGVISYQRNTYRDFVPMQAL